jgi:hypothetical protein
MLRCANPKDEVPTQQTPRVVRAAEEGKDAPRQKARDTEHRAKADSSDFPVIARSQATPGPSPGMRAISIAVHNGMEIASLRSQ